MAPDVEPQRRAHRQGGSDAARRDRSRWRPMPPPAWAPWPMCSVRRSCGAAACRWCTPYRGGGPGAAGADRGPGAAGHRLHQRPVAARAARGPRAHPGHLGRTPHALPCLIVPTLGRVASRVLSPATERHRGSARRWTPERIERVAAHHRGRLTGRHAKALDRPSSKTHSHAARGRHQAPADEYQAMGRIVQQERITVES